MTSNSSPEAVSDVTRLSGNDFYKELVSRFIEYLGEELDQMSNACMVDYRQFIKEKRDVHNSVYQFNTKKRKFIKPSTIGKQKIMSTINEEMSLQSEITSETETPTNESQNAAIVYTEEHETCANKQTEPVTNRTHKFPQNCLRKVMKQLQRPNIKITPPKSPPTHRTCKNVQISHSTGKATLN